MLVNLCQQLSADILSTGGLTTHQPFRRRHDIDTVTAKHFWDLARANVNTATGRGDSLQMSDRRCSARIVPKEDSDGPLQALALDDEVINVAFLFQDAGDFKFQFRSRNIDARVLRRN
jgi:hypothetical protein